MRPVDIIALLIMFGVLAASLLGLFDDGSLLREERRRPAPAGPALPDPSPRDPVVMVQESDRRGNSVGTAFSLDSDGVWMTARHVVEGCSKVGILRDRENAVRVQRIWIHPDADLAILSETLKRPALAFADRLPSLGETGYGIGYPQGNPGDVTGTLIGRAVSVRSTRQDKREPILTWAETARFPDFEGSLGGISGGPLFVTEGLVAGVVISGSPRRGRFNTAAPRSFPAALAAAGLRRQADIRFYPTPDDISESRFDGLGDALRSAGAVAQVFCLVE